jgi:hypothetical protein
MRSNGRYKPYNVIERLQVDLYQASIKQRSERQKQRNTAIVVTPLLHMKIGDMHLLVQSYCFQLLYFFVFDVLNVKNKEIQQLKTVRLHE